MKMSLMGVHTCCRDIVSCAKTGFRLTSDLLRARGEGGRLVAVVGACMERRDSLAGLCGRS